MSKQPTDSPLGLVRHEDVIQPFMLHNSIMRGRMVRMDNALNAILARHDYPEQVSKLLGELLMLAGMLSVNLPKNGILTLQVKGDGIVPFMVADAQANGNIRGYANLPDNAAEHVTNDMPKDAGMTDILGSGYLAMTLDTPTGEPYQGIVPLEGESLSDALTHYFTQSQQLDVMFHIHVSRRIRSNKSSRWVCGGIMLERMPEMSQQESDNQKAEGTNSNWDYHALLVNTATEEELSDPHLAPSALLYRLFNETGVWVYDTQPLQDACRCSREKIQATLDGISNEELQDMSEDGVIRVTCQFCSREERFTV